MPINIRCGLLTLAAHAVAAYAVAALMTVVATSSALAAPKCPIDFGARAEAKSNKLYLFYPTDTLGERTDPAVFPLNGFDPDSHWLPLLKFQDPPTELDHYGGSLAQLRDKVHDAVTDIYCEFNVQVITTTTPAPITVERRNVIGIGPDTRADRPCAVRRPLYGESMTAGGDPGDSKPVDFARVWTGSFNCSGLDLQLEGWANSIAGSAAHEAAHNYGLSHQDGQEDARDDPNDFPKNLMRRGRSYDPEARSKARYFSNFETSALARNVGLSIDTMWTWQFKNPNAAPVAKLRVELVSPEPTLILSWPFAGETSPWINPVLTAIRTRTNGDTVYEIEWSAANPQWREGPGQVPQDKTFQVGATLSAATRDGPAEITLTRVTLLDAGGQVLPLQPPWMGFDTGSFDDGTRKLNVTFKNDLERPLILRDVKVRDLQRVMSIEAMAPGMPVIDIFGRPFRAWNDDGRDPLKNGPATVPSGTQFPVAVADRKDGRYISLQRREDRCKPETDERGLPCHPGITIDDLFPATTMVISATIADAAGLGESRLFYQVAGRRTRVP